MKRRNKRPKWVILVIVAAVLVVATIITLLLFTSGREVQPEDTPQRQDTSSEQKEEEVLRDEPVDTSPEEQAPDEATSLDPATIGSIDIPPAGLVVSYIKGVGGFEYEVLRATDGRKYLELRNGDLVGTKCNDDAGVFVSILESPNESEKGSVSKTITVDGTEYGLSVASPTCTNDTQLLEKYQDAFVKPFTLLKKLQ